MRVWGPRTGPVARMPRGGLRATGVVQGIWVQAPPLPWLPALWAGGTGFTGHVLWARVRVCAVCVVSLRCMPWCVVLPFVCPCGAPSPVLCCGVVLAVCLLCPLPCAHPLRGCWLPPVSFVVLSLFLSLWCPPLRCFVAVLASPCACRAPIPARVASLARLLATSRFFRGFVALCPFLYSRMAPPPPRHALFLCLRLGVCLGLPPCLLPWSRFPGPLLSLLSGPVRQRMDGGVWVSVRFGRAGEGSALHTLLVIFVRRLSCLCASARNNVTYLRLSLLTQVCAIFVAFLVAWRVTYLCLHLCLCVCARSSPFLSLHTMVLVRGGGGRVVLAVTCACACFCVPMLPAALMAYREREAGGFHGTFSVGGCIRVAALSDSFS